MKNQELILEEVKKERGSIKKLVSYFKCRCKNENCTNIIYRDKYCLSNWSGNCKRCANLIKLKKARLVPNPTVKRPYEALYNNLLKNAIEKSIKVTLTYIEFLEFTKINNCQYCYEEVKWTKVNLFKNGSRYNLDRMNNSNGYEKSNLIVCCWRCNNSKGNRYSHEEWYGMTKYFRDMRSNL
jgi:hypothetical protein